MDNKGVEIILGHNNNVGDLNYFVSTNFTFNRNEIVYMDEAENIPEYRKKEGHPMNSWVVYETDGIFNDSTELMNYPHIAGSQPGDLKYIDVNEDGAISGDDQVRKYTSPIPEIQFGLDAGIRYKGIELNLFFQGQGNATTGIMYNDLGNRPEFYFTKRWTKSNPGGSFPRMFDQGDAYNKPSTHHLYNASFIRLKNAEIAYNFSALNRIPSNNLLNGLRIYLRGTNLWTWDQTEFFDPEIDFDAEQQSSLKGIRIYPLRSIFTAGLNLQF